MKPFINVSDLPDAEWLVDPPHPSGILAGVPALRSREEVAQGLADFVGNAINMTPLEPASHQQWLSQFDIPELNTPLLFFLVKRIEDDGLDVPIETCPYLLGLEGLLHPLDPLTLYINYVRLLHAAAGGTDVVWDVTTNRVLDPATLESAFVGHGVEPSDRILWVTEANELDDDRWVVRTRGLHRCGRAELAVTDVPRSAHQEALVVVDGLASLSLEQPLPAPEQPLAVGQDLSVRLSPAQESDRAWANLPTAIIRDPVGDTARDTLACLRGPEVSMYRSERTCLRETALARETWPLFIDACTALSPDTDCLVQVPFTMGSDMESTTYHLWLRVLETSDQQVTAEILHAPEGADGLSPGDHHTIDCETLSNWCIMFPEGPHGPEASHLVRKRLAES